MGNNTTKNETCLKIITYNVDLYSYSFIRYTQLLKFINSFKKNYIICLQGITNDKSYNKLIEDLKINFKFNSIYPSIINNIHKDNIQKSGLIIISDQSIIDYNFYQLPNKNSIKNINTNCGYIKINFNIDNNIFSIYNSQLISNYSGIINYSSIRIDQLKIIFNEIIKNIKNNKKHNKKHINLIVGSMNINDKELNFLESKKVYNLYKHLNKDIINYNKLNSDNSEYIFIFIDKIDSHYNSLKKTLVELYDIKTSNIRIRSDIKVSQYYPVEIRIKI